MLSSPRLAVSKIVPPGVSYTPLDFIPTNRLSTISIRPMPFAPATYKFVKVLPGDLTAWQEESILSGKQANANDCGAFIVRQGLNARCKLNSLEITSYCPCAGVQSHGLLTLLSWARILAGDNLAPSTAIGSPFSNSTSMYVGLSGASSGETDLVNMSSFGSIQGSSNAFLQRMCCQWNLHVPTAIARRTAHFNGYMLHPLAQALVKKSISSITDRLRKKVLRSLEEGKGKEEAYNKAADTDKGLSAIPDQQYWSDTVTTIASPASNSNSMFSHSKHPNLY